MSTPTTQAEIDALLTGIELELIIQAVEYAYGFVWVKDSNGFRVQLDKARKDAILQKLTARRTS